MIVAAAPTNARRTMDIFQAVRRDGSLAVPLIRALENINVTNDDGATLLHAAIAYGNEDAARVIIERGADVNAQDNDGVTPLHLCVVHDNLPLAELIFAAGGVVNLLDKHGNSPLWTAVFLARGKYELVQCLLRHGGQRMANVANRHGHSPYRFAKQIGDTTLQALLGCS